MVIWDNFVHMSGVLNMEIEIEVGAIFSTLNGQKVDDIRGTSKREMSLSEANEGARDASQEARARFTQALFASSKLAALGAARGGAAPRAQAATPKMALHKQARMVVAPLKAAGGVSPEVCGLLTSYMLSLLDRVGGLTTVGQADINAMLGLERQKDLLGCTSTSCAAEIGGALGAELFLYGEVGKLGSSYGINLTVVRTSASAVAARVSRLTALSEDALRGEIPGMIDEMVNDIIGAVP